MFKQIQSFLSKWSMVYALLDLLDQQVHHSVVKILVEEVVPVFGVPTIIAALNLAVQYTISYLTSFVLIFYLFMAII